MSKLIYIFRPLILMLLIFQVSIAYALPSGTHLNLCFGTDGHIDFTQDLCEETLLPLQTLQMDTAAFCEELDENCLDLELGCNLSSEVYSLSNVNIEPVKVTVKGYIPSLEINNYSFSSQLNSKFSNCTTSFLDNVVLLSSHLDFLSTISLLI